MGGNLSDRFVPPATVCLSGFLFLLSGFFFLLAQVRG